MVLDGQYCGSVVSPLDYFLLAFFIMIVSTLLLYKAAKYFGLKVDRWALVMCAVLAVAVNFAAIIVAVNMTLSYVMVIVAFVLIASAAVTGFNEYRIRRTVLAAGMQENAALATFEEEDEEAEDSEDTEEEQAEETPAVEAAEAAPEPVAEEPAAPEPKTEPEPVAEEPVAEPEPEAEPAEEAASEEAGEAEADDEPDTEFVGEVPEAEIVPEEPAEEEPEAESETAEEAETAPDSEETEADTEAEAETAAEETAPADEAEPETLEESEEELPDTLQTLDDYLDYAQEQKTAGTYKFAAAAYRKALDVYGDDPYTPFVVIDLGNLYKDIGSYNKAADIYEEALALPILKGQTDIQAEFKKNIRYLHTVSNILTRHNVPDTPFRKIPPEYLQEIETAFAEKRTD